MDREMEKLLSYTLDKDHIDLEDVQAICVQQIQTKIFDMISAIAAKDSRKVMLLYQDLLAARESPMRILYLIVRQFRQMMVIQEMAHREGHKDYRETGGNAGFRCQEKYGVVQKFYQRADVRTLLRDAAEFDEEIKTGRIDDQMAVELLMMKYA